MVSNIYGLFAEPFSECGNISDSYMIERPQHVFIKGGRPLPNANLNAIRHQIILPDQIMLLNPIV
jgi:hypothetical protein